jgi:alpha-glucosidase
MADMQWWQSAVFYQIYPRSFADGNGDGIGDFIGMAQKLDYLKDLGIDAIWLSPHFPSPQFDVGYDISDYCDVAPEYGTLEDFKTFLNSAHEHGMRVILDLVLNHTSYLHPWFIESRSSLDNPKRDWYIWREGKNGGPPNNWMSHFGGSAWECDETTGQYYYHFFLKEQPDLNWRNPELKQAMWDAVRFWLDLGVDGFRLDAIGTIYEDPAMPDHQAEITQEELRRVMRVDLPASERAEAIKHWLAMFNYQVDQPGVHELMQELRQVIDEYPNRMLIGESEDIRYHGDETNELHLTFNFPLMKTNHLTPHHIRENQRERLAQLPPGIWPCNTLNNHDESRMLSRYGDGQHDEAIARTSVALMLTLRGTPFLYNGEEIGMSNYRLQRIDEFRDPPAVWFYEQEIAQGIPHEQAIIAAADHSRDRCRTPFQWRNASNAGFSPKDVRPWLPVNPNYAQGINVEQQWNDPTSMLNFYKSLLRLRKQTPALIAGDYTPLHENAEDYFTFLRHTDNQQQTCLVVLNLSERTHLLQFEEAQRATCLFSTHKTAGEMIELAALSLAPFEVFIGELAA